MVFISCLLVLALHTLVVQGLHNTLEILEFADVQAFLVELGLLLHGVFLQPFCDLLQLQF